MSDVWLCDALRTGLICAGGSAVPSRERLVRVLLDELAKRNGVAEGGFAVRDVTSLPEVLAGGVSGAFVFRAGEGGDPASGIGMAADAVAARWRIGRELADIYALESHEKAVLSRRHGLVADEIVSTGERDSDALPRSDLVLQSFQAEPPLHAGGAATSLNCAPEAVGEALLFTASQAACDEHGWSPLCLVEAYADGENEAGLAGTGVIAAIERLLHENGRVRSDVGLWEIEELSGAHMLVTIGELDLPFDRMNVWGGAIARGRCAGTAAAHAPGTLARQMRRYGVEFGVAAYHTAAGGRAVLLHNAGG